jgi:tetraacyldisaccharide 4'-kinase
MAPRRPDRDAAGPGPWRLALLPLAPLYRAAVTARAALYRRGLLASERLPVPVLSVGNLTFGGTGKTPTVLALVRDLVRRGHHPAVVSRGYGRTAPGRTLVVLGPDPGESPEEAGDEALELANRLPGVPIVLDPLRARGGAEGLRRGADLLVLDDGFQHLALKRDLDLVLVDAGDPWGGGHLPPLGRLREPLAALKRASAVLVTKLPADPSVVLGELRRRLALLAPGIPVLAARLAVRRLRTPEGWEDADALRGRRVFAFSGLGRPAGFVDLLRDAGAVVVGQRAFPDHHRYRTADLDAVLAAAAAHQAVAVTTGKDAVKLPPTAPLWVVEVEMAPLDGSWDALWALRQDLFA